MLYSILGLIVDTVTGIFGAILLLRFWMQVVAGAAANGLCAVHVPGNGLAGEAAAAPAAGRWGL